MSLLGATYPSIASRTTATFILSLPTFISWSFELWLLQQPTKEKATFAVYEQSCPFASTRLPSPAKPAKSERVNECSGT